jgi:ABC-2 type transport system permease protein
MGHVGRITVWSGVALCRDRQVMFWSFGFFPLLLILFLGALSGGNAAVQVTLTSAVVTVAVMANALFSVGIGLASARDRGVFRRFSTIPVPRVAIVAAMVLARMCLVMASAALVVLLAHAVFGVPWSGGALGWLAVTGAGTAAFSAIGLVIAGIARAPHVANAVANLVFIPMMALGGTTLPTAMLPPPLDQLSSMLPSRAMVDGLTASFVAGASIIDLFPYQRHLLAWAVIATSVGAYAWHRRLS